MHLSPMNIDELTCRMEKTHELNRDAMLEKIILLTVSYFCVGTELRFLSQKEENYTKKDSEMWHAKALHTSCTFLPDECPLVLHIINSYKKHHLTPKLEIMEKQRQEEAKKEESEVSSQVGRKKGKKKDRFGLSSDCELSESEVGLSEMKRQLGLLGRNFLDTNPGTSEKKTRNCHSICL